MPHTRGSAPDPAIWASPLVTTTPIVLRGQRQGFPVHPVSSGDSPHPVLAVTTSSTTTQTGEAAEPC